MPVFFWGGAYIQRDNNAYTICKNFTSTHARNLAPQHFEVHFEDIYSLKMFKDTLLEKPKNTLPKSVIFFCQTVLVPFYQVTGAGRSLVFSSDPKRTIRIANQQHPWNSSSLFPMKQCKKPTELFRVYNKPSMIPPRFFVGDHDKPLEVDPYWSTRKLWMSTVVTLQISFVSLQP